MDPRLFNLEEYARKLTVAYCIINGIPVTHSFTDEELKGPMREVEEAKGQMGAAT